VQNEEDPNSMCFEILHVKLDHDTISKVEEKAKVLQTDISTFVKWYLHSFPLRPRYISTKDGI